MTRRLRLALLHLAPEVGAVGANRALVERATRVAAGAGADWVVSGELVIPGYRFAPVIGTDWIRQQPDTWMAEFARLHRQLGVVSFLSHPERGRDGRLFNSVFVISRDGEIIGRQRKLHPIPVSEDWSSPGAPGTPVTVDGINIGIVICADAYDERPARQLRAAGAELLVFDRRMVARPVGTTRRVGSQDPRNGRAADRLQPLGTRPRVVHGGVGKRDHRPWHKAPDHVGGRLNGLRCRLRARRRPYLQVRTRGLVATPPGDCW